MRRQIESYRKRVRKPVGRAAVCSVALVVAGAASAAAAGWSGASVPKQTDKVGSNRIASVKVNCPSGTTGKCGGKLTLKTAQKVGNSVLTLGSQTFSIASGKSSSVRVKISTQGWNMIKAHGSINPIATAASHDGAHPAHHKTRSTTITLKKKSSGNTSPSNCNGIYTCT